MYVCMYVCYVYNIYMYVFELFLSSTVVWEIFNGKNISWVLTTYEKELHENLLPQLINS